MNIIGAQKPLSGRINPNPQRPNGRFPLWSGTLFQVACGFIENVGKDAPDTIGDYWFTPRRDIEERYVHLLLFSQDYPVIIRPFSFYETPTRPDVGDEPCYPEMAPQMLGTFDGSWTIHTPDSTGPSGEGGATSGLTKTNQVRVSGFASSFQIKNHRLTLGIGDPARCPLEFDIATQGAVLAGNEYYLQLEEGEPPQVARAGFLRESDYTQAMADAGNMLYIGPTAYPVAQLALHIVGLFNEVVPGVI
jgi:hypothetical protein